MKKLQTLTAYPLSANKYKTEYGDRIRVVFTYEITPSEKDKTFYHTEKPLRVLELVDTEENFSIFMKKQIKSVDLVGLFSDFRFQLIEIKNIK